MTTGSIYVLGLSPARVYLYIYIHIYFILIIKRLIVCLWTPTVPPWRETKADWVGLLPVARGQPAGISPIYRLFSFFRPIRVKEGTSPSNITLSSSLTRFQRRFGIQKCCRRECKRLDQHVKRCFFSLITPMFVADDPWYTLDTPLFM